MPSKEQKRAKEKLEKKHASDMTSVDRKKQRHPIFWILSVVVLAVIAVSFLAGPALGSLRSSQRLIFGYYDGEPIEYKPDSYFARQRDMYAERIQQMQGSDDQNVQWQALQVWRGAYNQTVVHTAILQQAEKSGLHISDNKIDKALTTYGPYMENGEFSPELYRNTPNSEKYSARELFRENLTHEQWMQDYSSIPQTTHEKSFIVGMASPERKFRYASYNVNDYPSSAVREYAQENSELFRRIRVSRISLRGSEKEAKEIYSQLEAAPERFEELARNHSTDSFSEKGGDMGWQRYHELIGSLEQDSAVDRIFSLSQGETTGLLKTSFGWSIYRCDAEAQAPDLEDEQTINDIRNYLITNERGKVEDYFLQRASSVAEAARSKGFAEAVSSSGKELKETGYFPINYGGAFFLKKIGEQDSSGALQAAASNERVLKTLFSVDEGSVSEPFVLGTSVIVAEAADERKAPEDAVARVEGMYNYLLQNYRSSDVRSTFLNSDKLEDRFMEVFSKNFMNRNS